MHFNARVALLPTNVEIAGLSKTNNAKISAELLTGKGSRALDIGCGEGKFTRGLTRFFPEVAGVDVKERKIAEAQALATSEGVNVDFRTASGLALPWADHYFDVVIFSNSLHHMPKVADALREAMRVLRPEGLLYVMEPVASGNYHEATKVVNDETIVRTEAYEALSKLSGAELVSEILYRAPRSFASFEEWRDDQIDRDPKRQIKFDENPALARSRFESNALLEGGRLIFDQVFRVDLLRKMS